MGAKHRGQAKVHISGEFDWFVGGGIFRFRFDRFLGGLDWFLEGSFKGFNREFDWFLCGFDRRWTGLQRGFDWFLEGIGSASSFGLYFRKHPGFLLLNNSGGRVKRPVLQNATR